jgi:hypothetical protein
MEISTNSEVLLQQQRATLLQNLSNSAQASQATVQRTAVGEISDAAVNLQSLNTSITLPVDPSRGQSLDIKV